MRKIMKKEKNKRQSKDKKDIKNLYWNSKKYKSDIILLINFRNRQDANQ